MCFFAAKQTGFDTAFNDNDFKEGVTGNSDKDGLTLNLTLNQN